MLAASVTAGLLRERLGTAATFLAGAGFAVAALLAMCAWKVGSKRRAFPRDSHRS